MKKIVLILTVSLVCFAGIPFHRIRQSKKNLESAVALIQTGNFVAAELLIGRKLQKSRLRNALLGYCRQGVGEINQSDVFFHEFLLNCKDHSLQIETLLALSANALLENRYEESRVYLNKIVCPNSYLDFFDGSLLYHQKEYAGAYRKWAAFENAPLEDLGLGLFSSQFEKLFSEEVRAVSQGHCLLELQEPKKACETLLPFQNIPLVKAYIGFSYLNQAPDHFYLACRYFKEAGREPYTQAASSLTQGFPLFPVLETSIPLIHLFENWNEWSALDALATSLLESPLERDTGALIRKHLLDGPFHSLLIQKLLSRLECSLDRHHADSLYAVWEQLELLSDTAIHQVSEMAMEAIIDAILQENDDLVDLLQFWSFLPQDEAIRVQKINHLLKHAQLFWNQEEKEMIGMRLMAVAHRLSGDCPEILNGIENFLLNLYWSAEKNNMIERQVLVHEALHFFNYNLSTLASLQKEKIPNCLADARYLFQAQKYSSARTHALWVLKLEPLNQEALRLAGLSAFYLGDYSSASMVLAKLSNPDEPSKNALKLSEFYTSTPSPFAMPDLGGYDS